MWPGKTGNRFGLIIPIAPRFLSVRDGGAGVFVRGRRKYVNVGSLTAYILMCEEYTDLMNSAPIGQLCYFIQIR
jgi:hypothetical protein